MLSKEEVEKLAKLARIELKGSEVEKFQKELSTILDYVEELKKVNTDGIPEVFEVTGLQNIQREDKVEDADNHEDLFKNAPEMKDGYYKVKAIL